MTNDTQTLTYVLTVLTFYFILTGTECPGMDWGLPFSSNLPIRGPRRTAPHNAATPPQTWTTPLPAKS